MLVELKTGFDCDASHLFVLGYSKTKTMPIVSLLYASPYAHPQFPDLFTDVSYVSTYRQDIMVSCLSSDTYFRYLKYRPYLFPTPDLYVSLRRIVFKTSRLLLRAIKNTDYDNFYPFVKDKEIAHNLGRPAYEKQEEVELFLSYTCSAERTLAIVDKKTNKMIGNIALDHLLTKCCLDPQFKGKKGLSLSFALVKEYQHQGIMNEVLDTLIPFIFNELNADFINCGYFYFNKASKNLQHKFDFHYYATSYHNIKGEEIETIDNILYKEEYKQKLKKANQ